MAKKFRQVLPHGVMLVASVLLYWAATRIDANTGGRIGPAFWPKTIIVIMGLLSAFEIAKRLVVSSFVSAHGIVGGLNHSPMGGAVEPAGPSGPEHPKELAGGVALVAAYVAAVPWLGFFLTTALFLAVFPWAGGLRRPVLCSIVGLAGSLALIVVFMRVAYISLPLGDGPFRALSLALLRAIGVS